VKDTSIGLLVFYVCAVWVGGLCSCGVVHYLFLIGFNCVLFITGYLLGGLRGFLYFFFWAGDFLVLLWFFACCEMCMLLYA